MTNIRCLWISTFAILVILASNTAFGENLAGPPQLVPIPLKDLRWQPLPDRVSGVYGAPGGRVWFGVELPQQLSIDEMKAFVERTFAMRRPQVVGLEPVLFEPPKGDGKPGRVWFLYTPKSIYGPVGATLYGFAGEPGKWIERKPQKESFSFKQTAMMIGSTRFFVEHNLIHVFDGTTWTVHEVGPAKRFGNPHYATLTAEPDDKGLIVPVPGTSPLEVWRWREGVWQRHTMPQPEKGRPPEMSACVGRGGMWMSCRYGIWFSPFLKKDEAPPKLEYAERFGPYNFRILHRGLWFLESLPDGRVLLGARELWKDGEEDDPRLVKAQQIHDKMNDMVNKKYRHTRETMRMRQEVFDLAGGVVIANPDGTHQLIRGARALGGWPTISFGKESGALLAPRGLWTTGDYAHNPPSLIDLKKGAIVDGLPDPLMRYLHAVGDDGTVYASDAESPTIMAYRPKATDNIVTLRPDDRLTLATELDRCWVMEDGSVWARDHDGRTLRFDGRSWQPVPQLEGTVIQYLVVGKKKLVLARTEADQWILLQDDFVARSGELLNLIKANRERIATGFSGGLHRGSVDLRTCVAVDAKGHIWVSTAAADGVHVLVGDRWKSVEQPLNEPDAKQPLEGVVISSLGDGIYINGQTNGSTGAPAFLANVKDGKVVLEQQSDLLRMSALGRTTPPRREANIWLDANNGMWIPTFAKQGRDSNSRDAVCLTSTGEQQRFRMGRPILARENGEVWFTSMAELEWQHPLVHIWRHGTVRQTLHVPGLAASQYVFSTKSNVVWAFTSYGLRALINQESTDHPNYTVDDRVYVMRGVRQELLYERIRQIAYSSLGYFAVICTDRDSESHRLQLIPIPKFGDD